jgi:hypothetical protein
MDGLSRQARGSITATDQGNRRDVQTARDISVTTDKSEIVDRSSKTASDVETRRQQLEAQAAQGQAASAAEGKPLQETVKQKTDSPNQGLLGGALDGAGKVVPFVDKFSDIPKKLFGEDEKR